MAQKGTYRLKDKSGASCTIAVSKSGQQIVANIFAWWHTISDRNGSFTGEGELKNNTCVLKGQDDTDCAVTLTFSRRSLIAGFGNCMSSNLPDDFSGRYKRVTEHIPGDYQITSNKAHFYKTAGSKTPLKTYLVKGDKVSVDLENISDGQWVFINYINSAGKITSGYLPWDALKQ